MFHDGMWGGMWFGWIFWIVILGAIIWFVLSQSSKNRSNTAQREDTPLDILKKRYAKGEISKEQYDQMKKDLD